ncbi:MAG: homoserine kinase [Tepidimonas sp.]|uniref:homoserine kinase n=1 Tax=Tepidimonas sp. TaxID=2002775 RepID=UPI0040551887
MAVFTEVGREEAAELMRRLGLGRVVDMAGCAAGIENTNYFVSTERDGIRHEWVLTLFERLTAQQLPFYLHLMKHLASKGIPVPNPQADASGEILHTVRGKPAAVVNRLRGRPELTPGPQHCAQIGAMLARMHLAGRDYDRVQPNLRGLAWWNEVVPVILPHLRPDQAALLTAELAYQNHVASTPAYEGLARGPIHADLFRDNAMFEGGQLSGVFDFYFAGCDTWLFDLAVCLNDWCIDLDTGATDPVRAQALLDAYASVRPLTAGERALLPAMRRAGALRFWISRLWDWHLPRQAALLQPHDPTHFERVLRARLNER